MFVCLCFFSCIFVFFLFGTEPIGFAKANFDSINKLTHSNKWLIYSQGRFSKRVIINILHTVSEYYLTIFSCVFIYSVSRLNQWTLLPFKCRLKTIGIQNRIIGPVFLFVSCWKHKNPCAFRLALVVSISVLDKSVAIFHCTFSLKMLCHHKGEELCQDVKHFKYLPEDCMVICCCC